MKATKADLIVLVTADYWEGIPKQAFDILDGEAENVNDKKLQKLEIAGQKYAVWSRPAVGEFPPIVWLNHPQGKMTEYLEAALGEIKRVTGW